MNSSSHSGLAAPVLPMAHIVSFNGREFFAKVAAEALPERQSRAVRVGNDKDPVSLVIGANGSCRYTVPPTRIPERSEEPEN